MFAYFLSIFLTIYLPLEPLIGRWIPDNWYLVWVNLPEILISAGLAAVFFEKVFSNNKNKKILRDSSASKPVYFLILFIAWAIVSALVNFHSYTVSLVGLRQLLRFPVFALLFYLSNLEKKHIGNILKVFIAVMIVEAVIGLGQIILPPSFTSFFQGIEGRQGLSFTPPSFDPNWLPGERATGTMLRYDRFGVFLALGLILLLSFKRFKIAILPFIALIFTYSRTAWLGFYSSLIYTLFVFNRRDVLKFIAVLTLAGILFLFAYSFTLPYPLRFLGENYRQNLSERILQTFSLSEWETSSERFGRLFFLRETLSRVIKDNFVFGVGPGNYGGGAAAILDNRHVYIKYGLPFGIENKTGQIDNNWLSMWAELGTGGLLLFVLFLIVLWKRVGYRARACILAFSVFAFFGPYFEVKIDAFYFWMLTALMLKSYE